MEVSWIALITRVSILWSKLELASSYLKVQLWKLMPVCIIGDSLLSQISTLDHMSGTTLDHCTIKCLHKRTQLISIKDWETYRGPLAKASLKQSDKIFSQNPFFFIIIFNLVAAPIMLAVFFRTTHIRLFFFFLSCSHQ